MGAALTDRCRERSAGSRTTLKVVRLREFGRDAGESIAGSKTKASPFYRFAKNPARQYMLSDESDEFQQIEFNEIELQLTG